MSRDVKVLQFSLEGKFIAEFKSIKEAIQTTNSGAVGDCCRGRQKTSNGFIFKFKKDNNNSTDDLILEVKKESFILWKTPFEITKEMRKEKGANYKGRDIGPFLRLCPNCRINKIEYSTYDAMLSCENSGNDEWCKDCTKSTKGKLGKFSKKCDNNDCENIIYYKRKGDYDSGIENKTICQKCVNKSNSNLYIGRGTKGYFIEKHGEEKGIEIWNNANKKRINTFNKYWENNPEKLKVLIDKRTQARAFAGYKSLTELIKEKISKGLSNFYKNNPQARIDASNKKKEWNKNNPEKYEKAQQKAQEGYKHTYYVNGKRCQGSSEKAYMEYLLKNDLPIPERSKSINTTLGLYFPDFEFPDKYIEIKSTHTYKLLYEENKRGQLDKIIETSKLYKPVEIIVIDNNKKIVKSEIYK